MKKALLLPLLLLPMLTWAQTVDTVSQARLDSIDAKLQLMKLKEISVSAPKPVYSMTGEVVNYNVENDETVRDLTAWDAIRNAPTVQVDEEGNLTMRGSEQVEVWLNGRPTGMSGEMLKAFFESMSAEALARIEVIKNPSAKYMVEEGKHILNIVTSARLRTSELWLVGLSGNTRPYLSPWVSYVRNSDRMKFNIHLAGSHSHGESSSYGAATLTDGSDTTSHYIYHTSAERKRYFGDLMFNIDYKIDSSTDLHVNSFNILQGDYDNRSVSHREQWDYRPDTAHYDYRDNSESRFAMINGFLNFDIKHRFNRKGQNLRFGGVWNYLFNGNYNLQQRLVGLAEGIPSALLLDGYDRTSDNIRSNNTIGLSLTYNHPVDSNDELTFRLGARPFGDSHNNRDIHYLDTLSGGYALPDTLRNGISDYYTRSLSAMVSWRHEWKRTTLTVELYGKQSWLHIQTTGLFHDDTLYRFLTFEPSLSLTHRTQGMHYWRFQVSHSVNTPSGSDLTTARTYNDDSYNIGNRTLHSSYTEKATISWNKYFQRVGNMGIEAYTNYTLGGIESVTFSTPYTDEYLGRIISFSMPLNIASSYKAGVDANITYRPAAWVNVSLNASIYRQGYAVNGEPMQEMTSWSLYARLWTKIAKLVNLDANISYGNPTLGLYRQEERAVSVGIGASATLFDGHLSLRASISDLFDNNLYSSTVTAPTYLANSSSHTRSRYLTFGLTWRIGKLDLEYQAQGGAAGQ